MSLANNLTAELLVQIPKHFPQIRVWRQNTGMGIGMSIVKSAIGCLSRGDITQAIRLLSSRPIAFGVEGGADIAGIVGPNGQVLEIEVKVGNDRQQPSQKAFQAMIESRGGLYIIARDVHETLAVLKERD